jgi:hypothetical protein
MLLCRLLLVPVEEEALMPADEADEALLVALLVVLLLSFSLISHLSCSLSCSLIPHLSCSLSRISHLSCSLSLAYPTFSLLPPPTGGAGGPCPSGFFGGISGSSGGAGTGRVSLLSV